MYVLKQKEYNEIKKYSRKINLFLLLKTLLMLLAALAIFAIIAFTISYLLSYIISLIIILVSKKEMFEFFDLSKQIAMGILFFFGEILVAASNSDLGFETTKLCLIKGLSSQYKAKITKIDKKEKETFIKFEVIEDSDKLSEEQIERYNKKYKIEFKNANKEFRKNIELDKEFILIDSRNKLFFFYFNN